MYNKPLATMTDINVIQRQLDTDSLYRREDRESDIDSLGRKGQELNQESDIDSLGRKGRELNQESEDDDDLSVGSIHEEQEWETDLEEPQDPQVHLEEKMFLIRAALEEEEISEEDAKKIERWTRINECGFEIINGVKYSAGGSIIYSDYERDEETASEIAAKIKGDILRVEAIKRVEENLEAYKGFPRDDDEDEDIDWEAEGAFEEWQSRHRKDRDIYYANGGLTDEEARYYARRYNR